MNITDNPVFKILIYVLPLFWIPSAISAVCLYGHKIKAARNISFISYVFFSIPWILWMIIWVFSAWLEGGPDSKEWSENTIGIPIGIIMSAAWICVTGWLIKKTEQNMKIYFVLSTPWLFWSLFCDFAFIAHDADKELVPIGIAMTVFWTAVTVCIMVRFFHNKSNQL